MTEQDLIQARQHKWRLDGHPMRTLDDAREFIDSVGFCLMYPLRPAILVPTFIGAWVGADDNLPTWQHAYNDPRATEATDLMVRLLRERAAFEANPFGETNFLVSASVFPFFYGLTGDRNPRQTPKPGRRPEYSQLALDAFEVIRKEGVISKQRLREKIGREPSTAALDRALGELWSKLRITRVDYNPGEGSFWDALYRWAPELVREGVEVSVPEALSALIAETMTVWPLSAVLIVELFFRRWLLRRAETVLEGISCNAEGLVVFADILQRFEQEPFTSPRLQGFAAELKRDAVPASQAIRKLARIVYWIDAHHSLLAHLVELPLLYSIQVAFAAEAWRRRGGARAASRPAPHG
jgi:hypothetical protein